MTWPARQLPQMIALVEQLIARGHAYVAKDGVVYFSVESFSAYGRLSGNTLDKLREGEGGRISAQHQAVKRHPADFIGRVAFIEQPDRSPGQQRAQDRPPAHASRT